MHIGKLFVKIEDILVLFCDVIHQLGQPFDLIFLVSNPPLLFNLQLISQAVDFLGRFALIVLVADVEALEIATVVRHKPAKLVKIVRVTLEVFQTVW